MSQYPEAVITIANDYLQRVRSQLRLVPLTEQDDFLREIQSHLYEAYDQTAGTDDVTRILAVLRNFGDPAEVVSDRLPGAMVRTGTKRSLPLYIAGGILIALFGIPLGFGGFGVLIGLLAALTGLLIGYYAVAGSLALTGALMMLLGVTRMLLPELWDKLVMLGFIHMDGPPGDFLDSLSTTDAGFMMILFASALGAGAWGMFRLGKKFLRGMRFLFSLVFDWIRRSAQSVRRKLRYNRPEAVPFRATNMAQAANKI
jgi:uncharacterized membrane protein